MLLVSHGTQTSHTRWACPGMHTGMSKQLVLLKGSSQQILLSEMSLPVIEVLIERLLPKILG